MRSTYTAQRTSSSLPQHTLTLYTHCCFSAHSSLFSSRSICMHQFLCPVSLFHNALLSESTFILNPFCFFFPTYPHPLCTAGGPMPGGSKFDDPQAKRRLASHTFCRCSCATFSLPQPNSSTTYGRHGRHGPAARYGMGRSCLHSESQFVERRYVPPFTACSLCRWSSSLRAQTTVHPFPPPRLSRTAPLSRPATVRRTWTPLWRTPFPRPATRFWKAALSGAAWWWPLWPAARRTLRPSPGRSLRPSPGWALRRHATSASAAWRGAAGLRSPGRQRRASAPGWAAGLRRAWRTRRTGRAAGLVHVRRTAGLVRIRRASPQLNLSSATAYFSIRDRPQ